MLCLETNLGSEYPVISIPLAISRRLGTKGLAEEAATIMARDSQMVIDVFICVFVDYKHCRTVG